MNRILTPLCNLAALIACLCIFTPSPNLQAQTLKFNEFALFGGGANCPGAPGSTTPSAPGCGVVFGSSSQINGNIGSYQLVQSTGNVVINGNIVSGGRIVLANSNQVTGSFFAANGGSTTTQSISVGSSLQLSGNIQANGNISIGGGSIQGSIRQSTGSTYTGPSPAGGRTLGVPALPTLPLLPAITQFPAAGNQNITNNATLVPGSYGNMSLNGSRTVTLSGPGVYVFRSIKNTGNFNTIVFDAKGNTSGFFYLYIHGDVDLGKLLVNQVNGASASRIYSETHGNW